MRWLLVSSQHHPTHGGIGTYVSQFCSAAVDAGWHVELVTRPSELQPTCAVVHEVTTSDMDDGFNERLPALRKLERVRPYRYGLWSLAVAKQLVEIDGEFDAVEFVDTQAEAYVSLTNQRVRRHVRKIAKTAIVHAHTPMFVEEQINGVDPHRFGRLIYHEWERAALSSADGVMTASSLLRNRLQKHQHSAVISYPIVCNSQRTHTELLREDRIVFVGSVQPRKGVHVWARSLNQVFRQRPNSTATLIGSDTPTAPTGGSMVEHILGMVDSQFRRRIQWLGPQSHNEVLSHISRAQMVVVPSLFDNAPFVVSESLNCGTPVIVSDQVGWIEVVPSLPTVPAGDANALAEAQMEVLSDSASALERAHHCRQQLLEACNPIRHLNQRAAFVQSLHSSKSIKVDDHAATGVMDSMESFIASVECSERSLLASSSAGS